MLSPRVEATWAWSEILTFWHHYRGCVYPDRLIVENMSDASNAEKMSGNIDASKVQSEDG